MRNRDDKQLDGLLSEAFRKQYEKETANGPSDETLGAMHPFTEKQMQRAIALSAKNKKRHSLWTRSLVKAAAILLCISLVGFGVMMTDPVIRATVGDSIVKYIEEGFNIDFSEAKDRTSIDIDETVIGYIPEGFERIDERTEEKEDRLSYSYINAENEYLVIDILASSDIELITEDEHHELKFLNIGKYTGYISYSETQMQGSVYFGNKYFTIAVSGMTDRDELVKIAENIEIKE